VTTNTNTARLSHGPPRQTQPPSPTTRNRALTRQATTNPTTAKLSHGFVGKATKWPRQPTLILRDMMKCSNGEKGEACGVFTVEIFSQKRPFWPILRE